MHKSIHEHKRITWVIVTLPGSLCLVGLLCSDCVMHAYRLLTMVTLCHHVLLLKPTHSLRCQSWGYEQFRASSSTLLLTNRNSACTYAVPHNMVPIAENTLLMLCLYASLAWNL